MKKVMYLESRGCDASLFDESLLKVISSSAPNCEITSDIREADMVVLNACISGGTQLERLEELCQRLLIETQKDVPICVVGCGEYASPLLVPSLEKSRFKLLSQENLQTELESTYKWHPASVIKFYDRDMIMRVQHGCLRKCGFCKTTFPNLSLKKQPLFPLKSKSLEEIQVALEYIHDLEEAFWTKYYPSHRITISGQNPTEYGIDLYNGERKIHEVLEMVEGSDVINSYFARHMHPAEFYPKLFDIIQRSRKIDGLEIHLESANNDVLTSMNRVYTKEKYADVVKTIRGGNNPNLRIVTDIIVGYPGEPEYAVDETLDFLSENNVVLRFAYPFDDSIHLANQELERIPNEEVRRRESKCIAYQKLHTSYPNI